MARPDCQPPEGTLIAGDSWRCDDCGRWWFAFPMQYSSGSVRIPLAFRWASTVTGGMPDPTETNLEIYLSDG